MANKQDANPLVDPSNKNYYLLDTGERFLRVTSVLDGVGGDALISWAAGLAADYALEEITSLIKSTRKMPCGNTYKRCSHEFGVKCEKCRCEECEECVKFKMKNRHYAEKSRRADEGSRVHAVIEHWSLYENIPLYDDDIEPYVRAFQAFILEFGLKPDDFNVAEAAVINRSKGYIGTTDCILHMKPRTDAAADLIARIVSRKMRLEAGDATDTSIGVTAEHVKENKISLDLIADWKSKEKSEGFYINYALQLSAYRYGEVIRLRTALDHEIPIPNIDGAVIVQLRPDGYTAHPVVTDKAVYRAFLHLLEFKKWYMEFGSKSIGKKAFAPVKKTKVAEVDQIEKLKRQLEQTRARSSKRPKPTKEELHAMEVAEIRNKPYQKPRVEDQQPVKRAPSRRLNSREAVLGSAGVSSDGALFPGSGIEEAPF